MLGQHRLPGVAEDERGESVRGRRSLLEHEQAVVGPHAQLRRNLHDLQACHLLLRQDGVGAIGEEDVGLPACYHTVCDRATSGGGNIVTSSIAMAALEDLKLKKDSGVRAIIEASEVLLGVEE